MTPCVVCAVVGCDIDHRWEDDCRQAWGDVPLILAPEEPGIAGGVSVPVPTAAGLCLVCHEYPPCECAARDTIPATTRAFCHGCQTVVYDEHPCACTDGAK